MTLMTANVGFRRTDPSASPSPLVAAWLIDALGCAARVELTGSDAECIMLLIQPPEALLSVRHVLQGALAETRFAGWEASFDGSIPDEI